MRLALLLVALAACSKPTDRTGDPAVGRWTGESGKTIELRADGTLDMEPVPSLDCEDKADLIAACKARQTWSRSGQTVALSRGAIASQPASLGVAGKPCECRLERIDLQLRGDDLVFGTEHAHRVKESARRATPGS